MAKAFISYSGKDMRMVMRLTNDLIEKSPVSIFFAPWDIAAGESLVEKIQEALVESDYFIPFLSPNFLASNFAQQELHSATQLAVRKKVLIIPVIIGECEIPPLLIDTKYINFAIEDYDTALNELVEALMPAKNPLRNLDSLRNFLASGDHTPQSLVDLAKEVLQAPWSPEDNVGKGAQLIAKKLTNERHLQEALQVYNAAVEKFPAVAPLLILRSAIHRRREDFSSADQDCKKILELEPMNVRALLSRFWINHDWADRNMLPEEREQRKLQARTCITQLQTIPAAKTTYLHGYLHALAQGGRLCQEHSFANEAKELLEKNEESLYKRHSGRDQDAVLKAFKILEGFYRKHGDLDIADSLEKRRTKFENKWGRWV